jgi:hypothetical protein
MQDDASGHARQAVVTATTQSGLTLPVIDVTNPSFFVPDDPASRAARRAAFAAWIRERSRVPRFVTRILMRIAARRSLLLRALFQSDKGYLDGLSTYIMKLGPEHLPAGFDSPMDRKFASSPHVVMVRLRTQQVAYLLADALSRALSKDATAPLALINIAGGPALDSINAIILIKRAQPDLLKRRIVIQVLDAQAEGATFGANALAALQAKGAPLDGVDITFEHRAYDWNETTPLVDLLAGLNAKRAIIVASSEGGLFEYGTDEAVIANLKALHAGGVSDVAGSVTSNSELRKRMMAQTRFKLYPRGIEGFAPLAQAAGYVIARSEPIELSDQVLLRLQP